MIFFLLLAISIGSLTCENSKSQAQIPAVVVAAEEPPCHVPIKVRKEATRIIFIDCEGNETAINNSEITGPSGKPGKDGENGGPGRPGENAQDETISWCHHSPSDHINRTVRIKISEAVKQYGGYRGAQDFPGSCGQTENKCVCDHPVCGGQNPQVHHYLTGGQSFD